MATVIFPADPLRGRSWRVDEHFAPEWHSAASAGFQLALLDSSDPERFILSLPEGAAESPAIYRGWMLTEAEYAELERAAAAKGLRLLTDRAQYLRSHRVSGWIERFEALTLPTVLIGREQADWELDAALYSFPSAEGYFLRGDSKSIPELSHAASREELGEKLSALWEQSTEDMAAVRSWTPLSTAVAELRSWWLHGELIQLAPHPNFTGRSWDGLSTSSSPGPLLRELSQPIRELNCPLLTADLALTEAGTWTLIELGDGQVSGTARGTEGELLWSPYRRLFEALR